MIVLTMIARIGDGLILTESVQHDEEVSEIDKLQNFKDIFEFGLIQVLLKIFDICSDLQSFCFIFLIP